MEASAKMRLRFERSRNVRPKFHLWLGKGAYSAWCQLRLFSNIYTVELLYD